MVLAVRRESARRSDFKSFASSAAWISFRMDFSTSVRSSSSPAACAAFVISRTLGLVDSDSTMRTDFLPSLRLRLISVIFFTPPERLVFVMRCSCAAKSSPPETLPKTNHIAAAPIVDAAATIKNVLTLLLIIRLRYAAKMP